MHSSNHTPSVFIITRFTPAYVNCTEQVNNFALSEATILNTTFSFFSQTPNVLPLSIPSPKLMSETKIGSRCELAGWGCTARKSFITRSGGSPARHLRKAAMYIFYPAVCQWLYGPFMNASSDLCAISDREHVNVCSVSKTGVSFFVFEISLHVLCYLKIQIVEIKKNISTFSVFQGDSGSPLVCYDKDGNPFQAGITSGVFTRSAFWEGNPPAIFTKVSNYVQWIQDVTNFEVSVRQCYE